MFNDEAIFLRWAQLIASHPFDAVAIPLQDPKPPVHFVLLALIVNLGDPLIAGRVLSAIAGALTIVFAALLLRELDAGRAIVPAAVLLALSPFLAFHQRLATTDALFAMECVAVLWLAARVPRDGWRPLAIAMALTMGTRQVLSYLLWPLIALAVRDPRVHRKLLLRIAGIGTGIWALWLLAEPRRYLHGVVGELRRRIFFREEYADATPALARVAENALKVGSWLWTYLTPPVALAAVVSLLFLLFRGDRRTARLLAAWSALMILPLVVFGEVTFSRYVLAGAVPLLLILGMGLAALPKRGVAAALLLLSIWPLRDLWLQATRWSGQTFVASDRRQYVSGFAAGYATEEAARWLEGRASVQKIAVITESQWGHPADGLWVRLADHPRIRMYCIQNERLRRHKWLPGRHPAVLPPEVPIYQVWRGEPSGPAKSLPRVAELRNPGEGDSVVIVRVR